MTIKWLRYPQLRCDHCGQFMGDVFDAYTNYGTAYDMEPPDETFLCESCHWRMLISKVEHGQRHKPWRSSDADRLAGSIIRHLKRHPDHRDTILADLRARAA